MTTPNVTSSTDSQMHNNIMAVGSRDHPPMLAPGRYPQWRLRFLRYVNTRPNGEALRKCILSSPYKPATVLVQAVEATVDSSAIPEHTTVETPMNMSPEAIHLILIGIGDEIYSTVDAFQTAQEIWEAIERSNSKICKHPLDGFSAGLLDESNIFDWSVTIIGPLDTLYDGGFFNARMTFPNDYPQKPPTVQFTSEFWHPNGK
nr:ubiquitin-conjugating enzyme E2 7 [Tanacetum cinerariifolium]